MEDSVERLRLDIAEWRRLSDLCSRPRVKEAIEIEVRKAETVLIREQEKKAKGGETNAAAVPRKTVSSSSGGGPAAYDVPIKTYSWDQSDKFVKVYLTGLAGVQELPKEAVTNEFTPTSAKVRVAGLNGKNPAFNVKELNQKINPDASYVKIKSDMISVFLAKSEPGKKWSDLRPEQPSKFSAPKADAEADPQSSLMNMMKQMYEEGDDEMKRTIAKAWTESRDKTPVVDGL